MGGLVYRYVFRCLPFAIPDPSCTLADPIQYPETNVEVLLRDSCVFWLLAELANEGTNLRKKREYLWFWNLPCKVTPGQPAPSIGLSTSQWTWLWISFFFPQRLSEFILFWSSLSAFDSLRLGLLIAIVATSTFLHYHLKFSCSQIARKISSSFEHIPLTYYLNIMCHIFPVEILIH